MLQKKNGNKKGGDGEKKEKGSLTVVLKVDCLCDGCASKIRKYIRKFEGIINFLRLRFPSCYLVSPLFLLHFFIQIFVTFSALVIYSVLLCSSLLLFFFIFRGGDGENREQLKQSDGDRSCGSDSH